MAEDTEAAVTVDMAVAATVVTAEVVVTVATAEVAVEATLAAAGVEATPQVVAAAEEATAGTGETTLCTHTHPWSTCGPLSLPYTATLRWDAYLLSCLASHPIKTSEPV